MCDCVCACVCVCGFISAGAFGRITRGPNNTLAVRCRDDHIYMTCVSSVPYEVSWWHGGRAVTDVPYCTSNTDLFVAEMISRNQCNIRAALLVNATRDPDITSIGGEYGCMDGSNLGVLNTAVGIVLGKLLFFFLRNCLWLLHLNFYRASSMQSPVLAIVGMSVRLSVRPSHAGTE